MQNQGQNKGQNQGQGQTSRKPPYLFYSPKCAHCIQLINMIKKNKNLAETIQPVDIHTAKGLPPGLSEVPAILFNGQLMIGTDTFKWVQFQSNSGQAQPPSTQGQPPPQTKGQFKSSGPSPSEPSDPVPMDFSDGKSEMMFSSIPDGNPLGKAYTKTRFSNIDGSEDAQNGFDGVDTAAASDVSMANGKKDGMDMQLKHLQTMRDAERNHQNEQGGYAPNF